MYCLVITQAMIYTASGLCLHKNLPKHLGASTLIPKRGALSVLWTLLLITFMIHMQRAYNKYICGRRMINIHAAGGFLGLRKNPAEQRSVECCGEKRVETISSQPFIAANCDGTHFHFICNLGQSHFFFFSMTSRQNVYQLRFKHGLAHQSFFLLMLGSDTLV